MESGVTKQRIGLQKEEDNFDTGLINSHMLQELQDQFCRANNLYLVCLGKEEGVITKAYGSTEELAYLHSQVDESLYMDLVARMEKGAIESMIEQPLEQEYIRMCAISTKIEEKTQVIWVVIGILEERLKPQDDIPDYMRRTSEKQMYASVEFLSLLTRQLFDVKISQIIAQAAMQSSIISENVMGKAAAAFPCADRGAADAGVG